MKQKTESLEERVKTRRLKEINTFALNQAVGMSVCFVAMLILYSLAIADTDSKTAVVIAGAVIGFFSFIFSTNEGGIGVAVAGGTGIAVALAVGANLITGMVVAVGTAVIAAKYVTGETYFMYGMKEASFWKILTFFSGTIIMVGATLFLLARGEEMAAGILACISVSLPIILAKSCQIAGKSFLAKKEKAQHSITRAVA